MNQRLLCILIGFLFLLNLEKAKANLPSGSHAEDFTLTDINGNTYNLYSLLNAGKTVYIEFAASWCNICWNYHNQETLKNFYNLYGPNGTDEVMVLFIEAELSNNIDCLYGLTSCVGFKGTQGDFVTGEPFPIFDLTPANQSILSNYNPIGFPVIYCICPQTKTVYDIFLQNVPQLYSYVNSCALDYQITNKTNLTCKNNNTGSINITTYNGNEPLSFLWSNGATTEDLSGLSAGNYKLTITDANGIKRISPNITITEPPALLLSTILINNEGCDGKKAGSININLIGGTPAYSYGWNTGDISQDLSGLSAGNYSVTATDQKGCKSIKSFLVTSFPNPTASAGNDVLINCNSPTAILNGDGTFGASFKWTTNNGHIVSGANTLNPLVDKGGNYLLTAKFANTGCTTSSELIVDEHKEQVYSSIELPKSLNCVTKQIIINGSISSSGQNIKYEWYTNNGNILGNNDFNKITVDSIGNYFLVVENTLSKCVDTSFIYVQLDTIKPISAIDSSVALSCKVDTVILYGGHSTQGTGILYNWITLGGNIIKGDSTLYPIINLPGIYQLKVTNLLNGCFSIASDTVYQNPATYPEALFSYTNTLLNVHFLSSSSGIPEAYNWDFGDGNHSNEENPIHSYAIAGNYIVCLTTSNICGTNTLCQTVTITDNTNIPSISNISVQNVICKGGSDGCIDLTVINGTGPYSYIWSNGSNSEDICNLTEGIYSVTISDANGTNIISSNIIVSALYYIDINSSLITSPGCNEANGSIWLNINSNNSELKYNWSHDNLLIGNEAKDLAEGVYSVTVSDINGCSNSASIVILDSGQHITSQVHDVNCYGESTGIIDLYITGGLVPYTYLWNTGDLTEDLFDLKASIYDVQVTDSNGCVKISNLEVLQAQDILGNIVVTNSQTGKDNGSATLSVTGGTEPYIYLWSNGTTTPKIQNLAPGDYNVIVTDANDCKKVYSITITELVETNELDILNAINVFPNPTTGVFMVSAKFNQNTTSDLTITDIFGKQIYRKRFTSEKFSQDIDLSAYGSGSYSIRISTDKGQYTEKITLTK